MSTPNIDEHPSPIGIRCISTNCMYHTPGFIGGCAFQHILLRKGTCRHYKPGKTVGDRTDLPGDSYLDFIVDGSATEGT